LAVKLVRSLGYRASLKMFGGTYFSTVYDSRMKAQIGFYGWGSDYPAASAFCSSTLTFASFRRNSASNQNPAGSATPASTGRSGKP
jgi:hypothetical protein